MADSILWGPSLWLLGLRWAVWVSAGSLSRLGWQFCVKYAQRGRTYSTIEFMSSDVRSKAAAEMYLASHDGLRLAPTKRFPCHLHAHLVKFWLGGCIKEPEQNVCVCKWSLSYQKIIKNMLNRRISFKAKTLAGRIFWLLTEAEVRSVLSDNEALHPVWAGTAEFWYVSSATNCFLSCISDALVTGALLSCVPVTVNSADATEPLNRLGLIKDEFVEWSLQSGWQNCS